MAHEASTFHLDPLGDRAVVVTLGEGIDPALNDQVHHLAARVRASGLPGLVDVVPAYASLTLHLDPRAWSEPPERFQQTLALELHRLWEAVRATPSSPLRVVEIPVCYGGSFGPDLREVAERCGLPEDEVISRHAAGDYRVYLLGFAPGFAYLGGLDPALATPRRETPRLKVPAGSVGLAGLQTGIYPQAMPGGWQIIGRTPRRLFDALSAPPCLLSPGDRLRFVPITPEAFHAWSGGNP